MGRFWNFRTKLVAVLVLVLSGTFLLQTAIHEHNEQQLLRELEKVALDLANDTSEVIAQALVPRANPVKVRLVVQQEFAGRRSASGRVRAPEGRVTPDVRIRLQFDIDQASVEEARKAMEEELREDTPERPEDFIRLMADVFARFSSPVPPLTEVESEEVRSDIPRSDGRPIGRAGAGLLSPALLSGGGPQEIPSLDIAPHLSRIQNLFNNSKRHDLIATVGVFLIGIALAWFLGARVTRPVDEVIHGFQRLADGDFEARVAERRGEEFGHLGRQFNAMVDRLREGRELERDLSQRERIQHMGDLAAGVAHDVRNPLNAIHLNIGQIRDEFVPEDDRGRERFLRFTADVQREVERLNQLVSSFLSLAKPGSDATELVCPNEIVQELFRLLRKEATGQHVEMTLDLAEDLPSVEWNRQEMTSAFLNIAINALQSLREQGGVLHVATAERESRDGHELMVSFTDDGPGIPAEDLERVFVPYYTTREGGTGLGMAIARRTAERHGGRMELRSTVGEGTEVSFVFPSAKQEDGHVGGGVA